MFDQVFIAIDGSSKRDSTAIAVVAPNGDDGVRLLNHKIFVPSKDDPIDFEQVEQSLLDYKKKYPRCTIIFDSTQLEFMMQRLRRAGLSCEEFRQTPASITAMTQVLFDLIRYRKLAVYPDQKLRHAITSMLVVEKSTGMRFASSKQQKDHTDVVTALAMACLRCVQRNQSSLQSRFPHYDFSYKGFAADADNPPRLPPEPPPPPQPLQQRMVLVGDSKTGWSLVPDDTDETVGYEPVADLPRNISPADWATAPEYGYTKRQTNVSYIASADDVLRNAYRGAGWSFK